MQANTFEQIINKYRQLVNEGKNVDYIIEHLNSSSCSIIESLKVLRAIYNIDLEEAKRIMSMHPIWRKAQVFTLPYEDSIRRARDATSYGSWLEESVFGFHFKDKLPINTNLQEQSYVEGLLHEAINSQGEKYNLIIQKLTAIAHKNMDCFICVFDKYDVSLLPAMLHVLINVGFPENAKAIPWLIDAALGFTDDLSPRADISIKQMAMDILLEMDDGAVSPFIIAALMNHHVNYNEWCEVAERLCNILERKEAWALACMPTVVYLLGQASDESDIKPHVECLLSVIEHFYSSCPYVIPCLIAIVTRQKETVLGIKARYILSLYDKNILIRYKFNIEPLLGNFDDK